MGVPRNGLLDDGVLPVTWRRRREVDLEFDGAADLLAQLREVAVLVVDAEALQEDLQARNALRQRLERIGVGHALGPPSLAWNGDWDALARRTALRGDSRNARMRRPTLSASTRNASWP